MKKLVLLAAMVLAGLMAVPAIALADHIQVANNTPDAWVWVTIINGRNLEAWCVNPNSVGRKDYGIVAKVRVEVTARAGCAHPVMLDRTLDNYVPIPGTSNQVRRVGAFYVNGKGGAYSFGHN